jgi:hypothetical protein
LTAAPPFKPGAPCADECIGTHVRTLHAFCIGLLLGPRGHGVFHDDWWWRVFCFADEAHADVFRARCGGERFDPAQRGRGRN